MSKRKKEIRFRSKGSWKDFINMDYMKTCVYTDEKETKEGKTLKT